MNYSIDINADLGEGMGHDAQLMPFISSCSIACGGHYGDDESMRTAVRLAKEHKVRVGAHPSFPDRDHFGRKVLTMTKKELQESVYFQLLHFFAVCETEDAIVHHIKLHGALYNYAARDAPTADAVVSAIVDTKVRPRLYVQHGSVLHRKAENLLPLTFEAFIDRRYRPDGSLVPRSSPAAVIHHAEEAWAQLYGMVIRKKVMAVNDKEIDIEAGTFCIHGDHRNSVEIAKYIYNNLDRYNISLQ